MFIVVNFAKIKQMVLEFIVILMEIDTKDIGKMKFKKDKVFINFWKLYCKVIIFIGKEIWVNGDIFEGFFVNGLKNGKGIFKWKDGSIYEGEFKNNNIEG